MYLSKLASRILDSGSPISIDQVKKELERFFTLKELDEALSQLLRHKLILIPEADDENLPFSIQNLPIRSIEKMDLNIAQDCNLKCKYCINQHGTHSGNEKLMPLNIAHASVDFLLRECATSETVSITFIGGEPLLNFRVVRDTVKYGVDRAAELNKKIGFMIVTNGTLLNKKNIKFFKKYNVKVKVSIDGLREDHDSLRPTSNEKGSYDLIVRNIPYLLKDYQDNVIVRATLTKKNWRYRKLIKHLFHLGFNNVEVEPVLSSGRESYSLDEGAIIRVSRELDSLAQEALSKALKRDYRSASQFRKFIFKLCNIDGVVKNSFCDAGTRTIGVSTDGKIYPCKYLVGYEEFQIGDVFSGLNINKLTRIISSLDVDHKKICKSCWGRYLCGGGCFSAALKYTGSVQGVIPYSCDLIKKQLELSMWLYLELMHQKPEVFFYLLENDCRNSWLEFLESTIGGLY